MEETQRQVTRIVVFLSTFYFLLIALEIFWSHRQRRKLYTLRETLASLGTGIFYQALSSTVPMAAKIFFLNIAYAYAPVKWSLGWVHFGIAFLLADLFYYLQHRLNHSSDFFWAFHSAHHSSQEFNLMTGVRVSWVMPLFSAFFFMPLAFLGIDPNYIMISLALIFYGQWWCHTVYVGKLGWAEKIINTPSSHRVHHHPDGSISRANYAGLLIVWDRLFGTYRAEPGFIRQFGTDDGFVGHNPFVINLRGFAAYVARRIRPASAALQGGGAKHFGD